MSLQLIESIQAQRDALRKERDALKKDQDALKKDRDALKKHRDLLQKKCKQLHLDSNEIRCKLLWALSDVDDKDSTIKRLRKRIQDTNLHDTKLQDTKLQDTKLTA